METDTDGDILDTCRRIARHFSAGRGLFAYAAFEHINAAFFGGRLPTPWITWGLTSHGRCLGFARTSNTPPTITLHPSLLGGTEKRNPWKVDPALLGACYAYDTLLHECIHVSAHYLLHWDGSGASSHNNPVWVGEVNRIAPLLGFAGIEAGMNKAKRVPIGGGELTKTGKPATKVEKATDGNIPYSAVCRFPRSLRQHLGDLSFYRRQVLPFAPDLEGLTL